MSDEPPLKLRPDFRKDVRDALPASDGFRFVWFPCGAKATRIAGIAARIGPKLGMKFSNPARIPRVIAIGTPRIASPMNVSTAIEAIEQTTNNVLLRLRAMERH